MKDILIELITKPIRYTILISIILTISALLGVPIMFPSKTPYLLSLISFLSEYAGIILTVFFVSIFLFTLQLTYDLYLMYKNYKFKKT